VVNLILSWLLRIRQDERDCQYGIVSMVSCRLRADLCSKLSSELTFCSKLSDLMTFEK